MSYDRIKSRFNILIILVFIACLWIPNAYAQSRLGAENNPVAVKLLDSIETRDSSNEATIKFYFEIVVGLIQTFIFFLQLLVFNLQLKAFRQQAKFMSSTVTQMESAEETSRKVAASAAKSADASTLSAQAIISAELPFLNIEKVTTAVSFESSKNYEEFIDKIVINIAIKNYGRTPAFIDEILTNICIAQRLPKQPVYNKINQFPNRYVVKADGDLAHTDYSYALKKYFNAIEVADLEIEKNKLYIYGYVAFKDFLGRAHRKGFVLRWSKDFWTNYDDIYPEYGIQQQIDG
jgi:hypothetical protein